MRTRTLLRQLGRLEARLGRTDYPVDSCGMLDGDAVHLLRTAGMTPDAWQEGILHSRASRSLVLASRQSGKSSVAAALALHTALVQPRSPILLLSPSLRQSGELFRKVRDLFGVLNLPMKVLHESAGRLELANGSRILGLPGSEDTVRGFSGVALLVIDEAARVPDELYYAVRPMLAVSQGRLIALSTPFGKRGWFYEAWSGDEDWQRVRVTAEQCPRITREFLADERRAMGERWFRQEYQCSFEDAVGQIIPQADIDAAFEEAKGVSPLWER